MQECARRGWEEGKGPAGERFDLGALENTRPVVGRGVGGANVERNQEVWGGKRDKTLGF